MAKGFVVVVYCSFITCFKRSLARPAGFGRRWFGRFWRWEEEICVEEWLVNFIQSSDSNNSGDWGNSLLYNKQGIVQSIQFKSNNEAFSSFQTTIHIWHFSNSIVLRGEWRTTWRVEVRGSRAVNMEHLRLLPINGRCCIRNLILQRQRRATDFSVTINVPTRQTSVTQLRYQAVQLVSALFSFSC